MTMLLLLQPGYFTKFQQVTLLYIFYRYAKSLISLSQIECLMQVLLMCYSLEGYQNIFSRIFPGRRAISRAPLIVVGDVFHVRRSGIRVQCCDTFGERRHHHQLFVPLEVLICGIANACQCASCYTRLIAVEFFRQFVCNGCVVCPCDDVGGRW